MRPCVCPVLVDFHITHCKEFITNADGWMKRSLSYVCLSVSLSACQYIYSHDESKNIEAGVKPAVGHGQFGRYLKMSLFTQPYIALRG